MDPTFETLFALLPPEIVSYVYAFLAFSGALSAVLVALRPFLAKVPAGPARAWIDALDKWLGILALNTKPLVERLAKPPAKKEKP